VLAAQIWFQEDFRNYWDACPWEEDLAYARAVCDQARVPLKVVPLTAQYWERVVAHSLGEIAAGRTPNPDVLCNSRIKFGAFLEHVAAAHPGAFDRVASGHYARVQRARGSAGGAPGGAGPPPLLRLSEDDAKDQTYFLAGLSAAQLRAAMFPLGCLPKPAVRQLAAAGALPTAARKDSQGICFLGKVKFSEFVAEHLGARPGPLLGLQWATVGRLRWAAGEGAAAAEAYERALACLRVSHGADHQLVGELAQSSREAQAEAAHAARARELE
jgi:tRNA-specific 2-thiouridylase